MKTLYMSGQMRSGTSLVSTFLGRKKGFKILVDQARILTASGQAFKGKSVDFDQPLNVIDRVKLFESFINVTLWAAKNRGEEGRAVAMKRLAPFVGYIRKIRSWESTPHVFPGDIIDLPTFRTHIDFFEVILEHSVPITNRPSVIYAGNKETRGEEFAAAMSNREKKAIVLIRDPRAVVSSLVEKIGKDPTFGVKSDVDDGIARWLKGYDIISKNPRIHVIRYEDFILDHEKAVKSLSDYLDVELEAGTGIDTNNSSFADVEKGTLSDAGITRWRNYADQKLIGTVTERCKKQIEALGYDL